jgi:iron complex transport system substrate-binding protein
MKRFFVFLLILSLVAVFFVPVGTKAQGYKPQAWVQLEIGSSVFNVDGFDMTFTPKGSRPVIINNLLYIPLRGVVEAAGGGIGWDSAERKVTISLNNSSISFVIGGSIATVNGADIEFSQNPQDKPVIIDSRTLIPAQFLAQSLNGKYDLNGPTGYANLYIDKQLVQVTDVTGRKVLVPKKIYKIVSLYPMSTELLFPLGAQDELIATPKGKVVNMENFEKVMPRAKSLPDAGNYVDPNVETILSYKPDLVITTIDAPIKTLEDAGIPVVVMDQETPQLMLKSIQFLGNILGREEEARNALIYLNEKLNYIKERADSIKNKATVYIAGSNLLSTFGGDFYQTYLSKLAGTISVSSGLKGGKVNVSPEQIIAWNPDYIILTPYCSETIQDVLNNPQLKDVKAVKDKNVYRMPSYILSFDLPAPESILGVMWLSNTIYPRIVNFNINQEAKEFYRVIYNFDIPQFDLKSITGG